MGPKATWGKSATSHAGKQVGPAWPAKGVRKGPELEPCPCDGNREPLTAPGCHSSTHEAGGAQPCSPRSPWVEKMPHFPSPQVPYCLVPACPGRSGAVLALAEDLGPGRPLPTVFPAKALQLFWRTFWTSQSSGNVCLNGIGLPVIEDTSYPAWWFRMQALCHTLHPSSAIQLTSLVTTGTLPDPSVPRSSHLEHGGSKAPTSQSVVRIQ